MDFFCEVCDRAIIEKESEYKNYIATLRKKNDESLYKKLTINNINLDEVDKMLNDYVTTHNKKFDCYSIYCEFKIEFDNNLRMKIKTDHIHIVASKKIKIYLLYYIDCSESRGYKFCNINQMTIKIIGDRCNMKYDHYINLPMNMCARRINLNIAKIPELIKSLNRNKKHPLIRNYSHIPFNN